MVSIVVPTFNRAKLIKGTIESVVKQSYSNLEIIVIDDHSNDETEIIVNELINLDSRIQVHKRPSQLLKGANSCRNYGLELSKGEFIKWLDSDDLLTSDALKIQVESLISSGADLSICNSEVFDFDPSYPRHIWGNIESEASVSNFLQSKFRWHTGSGLWRKSYFSGVSPWKEGLTNSQEWLMHLTQLVNGVSLVRVPQTLCLVRSHSGSMSHKSNKSASYYYNELKARKFAFDLLHANKAQLSPSALRKIRRQFFIYHLFTIYKLGLVDFFKGFGFYLSFLKFNFSK